MPYLIRYILSVAALTSALSSQEVLRGTTADDLPHQDTAIHWPKAFDPRGAPLFSHNEILIHADCHRVFTRLADVTDWPNWFVLTKNVTIDDSDKSVKRGTLLRLTIFGTPITARIDEFVPDSRLGWIPMTVGDTEPYHYHAWHFIHEPTGCRVVTEETGIGPGDVKAAREGTNFMHRAHDLWLASLRWTSEQ